MGEVVCTGAIVTRNSTSNTVEIKVSRLNNLTSGTNDSPPFPTPYLLLNNIVSFDEHDMYVLLYPRLQDPNLCRILSSEIASKAKRVQGSFDVTIEQYIIEEETCAICLEDDDDEYLTEMPNCTHEFHSECITAWLCMSNSCPTCRAPILDDYDCTSDDDSTSDDGSTSDDESSE